MSPSLRGKVSSLPEQTLGKEEREGPHPCHWLVGCMGALGSVVPGVVPDVTLAQYSCLNIFCFVLFVCVLFVF